MKNIILFCSLLLTLTFSTVATAQTSVGGGLVITSGNDVTLTGANLRVLHTISKVRLAGNINFYFPKNGGGFFTDVKTNAFSLNPDLHYVFFTKDELEVYGVAGVQLFVASVKFNGNRETTTSFGGNVGAGAAYRLTENLAAFAEPKLAFADGGTAFLLNLGVHYAL